MSFFDEFKAHHEAAKDGGLQKHDDSKAVDLASGAAAFAAMKAYEDHKRQEGAPTSHQAAKQLFTALAVAEAARLLQTKGADWYDKEKAERAEMQTKKNAELLFDEKSLQ